MGGEVTYFTKATSTTKLISAKLPIITQKIIQNKRKKKHYPPTESKVERKKDHHNETALNGGKWDYLLVNMQIYTDLSSTFKSLPDHKKDFPWYVS